MLQTKTFCPTQACTIPFREREEILTARCWRVHAPMHAGSRPATISQSFWRSLGGGPSRYIADPPSVAAVRPVARTDTLV